MDKKSHFFISAIIAFSFYILVFLAFLFYLQSKNVKKFQSVSKNTVLELDLVVEEFDKEIKNVTKSIQNIDVQKSKSVIKKSTANSSKKRADLKSLFAKVSTKATKIVDKNVLNVKSNEVNSRFKSKYQKQKREKDLKVSKLLDVKSQKRKTKSKTITNKGNFDEYYSKISSIILSRWYNYPLLISVDYLVVAEIIINAKGKFSYQLLSLSGNNDVDNAVKRFLENQILDRYPVSPDGETKIIKINFKPDIDQN